MKENKSFHVHFTKNSQLLKSKEVTSFPISIFSVPTKLLTSLKFTILCLFPQNDAYMLIILDLMHVKLSILLKNLVNFYIGNSKKNLYHLLDSLTQTPIHKIAV